MLLTNWRKPLTLLGWMCIASLGLRGQTLRLTGRVVSSDEREALPDARIQVLALPDSLPVGGVLTDEDGRFGPLPCSSFNLALRLSAFGYEPAWRSYRFQTPQADTLIDLGDLPLLPRQMPAIEIERQRIQTNLAGDTVTFHAQAFGVHEDASVQDLLARLPGLELRGEDLYYNGVKIERIRLDGRTYAGREALLALAYLPARVVDQVVVQHDKHAAQKEAGSLDPILELNIIRKREYQSGWSGNLTAGGGTEGRYRFGGRLEGTSPRRRLTLQAYAHNVNQTPDQMRQGDWVGEGIHAPLKGRLSFNDSLGRHTALTVSGSTGRTQRELRRTSNLLLFQPDGSSVDRNEAYDAPAWIDNASWYLEVESRFDSLRKLELTCGGWFTGTESEAQTRSATRTPEGFTLNSSDQRSTGFNRYLYSYNNLEYVQRWPNSRRRLEIYGYGTWTRNRDRHRLAARNTFADGQGLAETFQRLADTTRNDDRSVFGRTRWVEPVGKAGELEIAYSLAPKFITNETPTWDELAPQPRLDTLRSSDYRFDQLSHTGILGYTHQPKWGSIGFQLMYSWVNWTVSQRLPAAQNLARDWQLPRPQLTLNYKLKPSGYVRVTLSTYFHQPQVQQLAAQIDYRNPLLLRQGDPALRPFATYNAWIQSNWSNPKTERNLNCWAYLDFKPRPVVSSLFTQGVFAVGDTLLILEPGQQLIRSEQHPWELSSWQNLSYSLRANRLKSNFTFTFSNRFARQVNRIDGQANSTLRLAPTSGLRWTSQFGKGFSASCGYALSVIYARQTGLARPPDLNYIHSISPTLDWTFWPTWRLGSDLSFRRNTALAAGLTPTVLLWNVSLTHKFLRGFRAEAGLYCFDLLDQNRPASREVTANYIRDQEVLALSRYVLLFFTYRLGAEAGKK